MSIFTVRKRSLGQRNLCQASVILYTGEGDLHPSCCGGSASRGFLHPEEVCIQAGVGGLHPKGVCIQGNLHQGGSASRE